ncbi:hypothetical protein HDR58_00595 [bacterium]|nr:hypothetical protein [bacterium]
MNQKYNYNKNKNKFTGEMINDTLKYQKQYGFKIGENNVAHNNESDAFRHTYMQGILSQRYTSPIAKIVSNLHEIQGKFRGQDPREANMDLWNNQQGQQIYNEICKQYPNFKSLSGSQQKDIIAQKVVQRMRAGELITGLDDKRQYKGGVENIVNGIKKFQETDFPNTPTRSIGGVHNGSPTGFATSIDNLSPKEPSEFFGYTNPLTGSNKIYTREDVGNMSPEEFASHEKEIDAQIKAFNGTMPTNQDLQTEAIYGGQVVYVNSYTRSDGTKVNGYYRSR